MTDVRMDFYFTSSINALLLNFSEFKIFRDFWVIFYVHGILYTNSSSNEHPVEYKSISGLILRGGH